MTDRSGLRSEFLRQQGWGEAEITALPGDASHRRYWRLKDGPRRAMLMDAPPDLEPIAPFIAIAEILLGLGYSAPALGGRAIESGFLLLEDLGDTTYTRLIRDGVDEAPLYGLAIDLLADLHRRFDPADAPAVPAYSDRLLLNEAALLVDWFLPAATGRVTDSAVRETYLSHWQDILPIARRVPQTLVLRDYHIDNLMRLDDRPGIAACGLLDFQDAVIGPIAYDVISLLEDARRDVPTAIQQAMRRRYLDQCPSIDPEQFDLAMTILGAQRHAKVIGIFCRLARRDGKPNYLQHLPRLWRMFEAKLAEPVLAPMKQWVDDHIPPTTRKILPCAAGEGDHAQHGGGGATDPAPSTPLRAVPLPRFAGEDPTGAC